MESKSPVGDLIGLVALLVAPVVITLVIYGWLLSARPVTPVIYEEPTPTPATTVDPYAVMPYGGSAYPATTVVVVYQSRIIRY